MIYFFSVKVFWNVWATIATIKHTAILSFAMIVILELQVDPSFSMEMYIFYYYAIEKVHLIHLI